MSSPPTPPPNALTMLANYLFNRREPLLNTWRARCSGDATLAVVNNLTREEFNDCIPILLNILDQRLMALTEEADARQKAAEHGLHRWHKGYGLLAALAEIMHLQTVIGDEIGGFVQLYPETSVEVVQQAHRAVASLIGDIVTGSIEQYDELQRSEAAERAANLQRALDELHELGRQRGEYLRTAAHDLRGSLGVVSGAASLLEQAGSSEGHSQMVQMLQRNTATAWSMLNELMDLARLEAGQERLTITTFDVAKLLHEQVQAYQPLAREHNLSLQADGPASLPVQGDALKLQRIAQNLLGNALRYTQPRPNAPGWVSVTWLRENHSRWLLSVQDSGSGLPPGTAIWLSEALKPTQDTAGVLYNESEKADAQTNAANAPDSLLVNSSGDAIGLFVVKKLSELLNASMDIELRTGRAGEPAGTIFRLRFPVEYPNVVPD